MRRTTRSQPLGASFTAILTVALLIALGGTARAEDSTEEEESRTQRARQIITQVEESDAESSWLRTHIHIRKKRGIEYSRPLAVGKHKVLFSVHGPLMSKKRLGLGFELRF
jgi:hypothetical protein